MCHSVQRGTIVLTWWPQISLHFSHSCVLWFWTSQNYTVHRNLYLSLTEMSCVRVCFFVSVSQSLWGALSIFSYSDIFHWSVYLDQALDSTQLATMTVRYHWNVDRDKERQKEGQTLKSYVNYQANIRVCVCVCVHLLHTHLCLTQIEADNSLRVIRVEESPSQHGGHNPI